MARPTARAFGNKLGSGTRNETSSASSLVIFPMYSAFASLDLLDARRVKLSKAMNFIRRYDVSGCDGKAKGGLDYCVDKNDYPEALHPHISAKASDYKNNIFARPPVSRPTPARPPTPQGNFSGTLVKVCSQSKGPCRILQKCEGDCDNDAHCAGGLVCFQRRKKDSRTVPTCNGLAEGGTDYCVDENDFFNKRK